MTTVVRYRLRDLPRTYRKLMDFFPPRPIHHEEDYEEALAIVEPLVRGENELTPDQADYMEALTTFIEAYEDQHDPIPNADPVDVLKALMEEHGLSMADLGRILGDRSTATRVLKGERELSKAHIKRLTEHFGLSADVFLK